MMEALRNRSVNWRIFTDSVFVAVCLATVKAAGALKVVMLARAFGATDALDAYLIAFLLPSFLGETLAGSLPIALIPALIHVRERNGRPAMERIIASIAAAALCLLSFGALLLAAASPVLLPLLAAGFSPEKRGLTQDLFYALAIMIPLSGLSIVWRAALNAEESFAAAALAPGCTPLLVIAVLAWTGPAATVWVLAGATVTGLVLELSCLAVGMRRAGLPVVPRWHGWNPAIRTVAMQHLPLIAVATIGNGTVLVDQSMAAALGSGSVSALNYGSRLSAVLSGIAGGALSTAALPQFSRMVSNEDWVGVRRTLRTYSRLILLVAAPAAMLAAALSPLIVRILFLHGAFTAENALVVTAVQRISLLAAPVVILNAMLIRLISSLRGGTSLALMALGALAVNTAGDYVLRQWFGLPGIPLAAGMAQLLSLAYLWLVIRARIGRGPT